MPRAGRISHLGMTVAALLACLVFLAGFGALRYFLALESIDRQVDLRLRAEMTDLIGTPEPSVVELTRRVERRAAARASFAIGYLLLDPAGRPVAGSVRMNPPPSGVSDVDFSDRLEGLTGVTTGRALAVRLKNGSEMVVVADTDPLDHNRQLLAELLAVGFMISALAVAGGMAAIMVATNRRMAAISATAQAIMQGDMTQRLPVSDRDDAFEWEARLLNRMLDRIDDLMGNIRNVSNDIAHDLRTPLTRLRGRLVAAETLAADDPASTEIRRALADCDQLLGLFAAILRLSEIDSGQRRAAFAPVALDEVIGTIADSFVDPVTDGGRRLVLGPVAKSTISGDRTLLAQMAINAIDNAVQHTPPGTAIVLSLGDTPTGLGLTIADNGPGIAVDSRERALRRFGKLEKNGPVTGYGLGLTLIASIARLHDAELRLGDNNPGLIVTILFPDDRQRPNLM